jgi:hypothetical protein
LPESNFNIFKSVFDCHMGGSLFRRLPLAAEFLRLGYLFASHFSRQGVTAVCRFFVALRRR